MKTGLVQRSQPHIIQRDHGKLGKLFMESLGGPDNHKSSRIFLGLALSYSDYQLSGVGTVALLSAVNDPENQRQHDCSGDHDQTGVDQFTVLFQAWAVISDNVAESFPDECAVL